MERPALLRRFFKPIAGGSNLSDLPEKERKPWRVIFSKGFNAEHVLSLVPGIVTEVAAYCESLRGLGQRGELFHLDPVTLRLTMDLIGRTILNSSLGAQRGYNTLADCMTSQTRWHQPNAVTSPLEYLNVARWYMQWWNGRQMDDYIGKELDRRYNEHRTGGVRGKAVIGLILQGYISEETKERPERLDPTFRTFTNRQIRLFVFAGHDSTSSTICYAVHLLATHPDILARLRSEHDTVLGTDLSAVPSILSAQPHLTNSLPYTTAVLKETLRLFPPASCSRAGKPGVDVTDDQGNRCPTDDAMVWTLHHETHRASKYWRRPDEFLPERWLADPGDDLYPLKGAWRPFEHGPTNCLAQGLVMIELRVVLSLVAREFDFKPCYDEWDRLHSTNNKVAGPGTHRGERAYQIEEGAAHPVDHYPCRIFVRKP